MLNAIRKVPHRDLELNIQKILMGDVGKYMLGSPNRILGCTFHLGSKATVAPAAKGKIQFSSSVFTRKTLVECPNQKGLSSKCHLQKSLSYLQQKNCSSKMKGIHITISHMELHEFSFDGVFAKVVSHLF